MCDFYGTKEIIVRDRPLSISFKIDDIINQLIDNCKNKVIKDDWIRRK